MNIAIDISGMLGIQGGISLYTENIVWELSKLDNENQYYCYAMFWKEFSKRYKEINLPRKDNFKLLFYKIPQKLVLIAENRLRIPFQQILLSCQKIDIFDGFGQILPLFLNKKKIKTVLHIHHIDVRRHYYNKWQKFYFEELMSRSIQRADWFIADSVYTKNFLVNTYNVPKAKVSVIYLAPSENLSLSDPHIEKQIRTFYNIPEKYILCVAHITIRKNITGLIKAYSLAREKNKNISKLVIVGHQDPYYFQQVLSLRDKLKLQEHVIFTGAIPNNNLPGIYKAAELFVLPTFLEGFGLAPIEAMKFGVPVITSNVTCVPEIISDAGILVDPNNIEEIANAIDRVINDSVLRKNLIDKGYRRAAFFSWEKSARQHIEVYTNLMGRSSV